METSVDEWIDGVRNQDTWSIFSALTANEVRATVTELERRFAGVSEFDFVHDYDVAIFEKSHTSR